MFDTGRTEMDRQTSQPLEPPFIKPQISQEASPLFKLPFELRIKIWRYLFKAGHALRSQHELMMTMPEVEDETNSTSDYEPSSAEDSNNEYSEDNEEDGEENDEEVGEEPDEEEDYEDPVEKIMKQRLTQPKVQEAYRNCVELSSQILRTCQAIYVQGSAILYPENTLSIFCDDEVYISLLDIYIKVRPPMEGPQGNDISILDLPYLKDWESSWQPNVWHRELRHLCPWLTKFGRYQITMHAIEGGGFNYHDPIQVPLRVLSELLKNQNVSLIFENNGRKLLAKDIASIHLSACFLHCKTIQFEGPMTACLIGLQRIITGKI